MLICLRKDTNFSWTHKDGEVQFAYADTNCNFKVKFSNNEESFFQINVRTSRYLGQISLSCYLMC